MDEYSHTGQQPNLIEEGLAEAMKENRSKGRLRIYRPQAIIRRLLPKMRMSRGCKIAIGISLLALTVSLIAFFN